MKKRIKIRDKYIIESSPNRDIDMIELLLPPSEVDKVVERYAIPSVRKPSRDLDYMIKRDEERKQMRSDVYKAAASCLTNRQFEIFILRYKGGFKEREISAKLGVNQPYISIVLHACNEKLKRKLGFPSKMKSRQFYKLKEIKENKSKAKTQKGKAKTVIKTVGKNASKIRGKKGVKDKKGKKNP